MTTAHANTRLEALCDGVFAIALTLLILDVRLESPESITSTSGLWHALRDLLPTGLAFALSFGVIFVTWVNHHAVLKLVDGTSPSFIYGNGFLLLTVALVPFPSGLLGTFLLTDHAAPAVVVYDAVLSIQAIGWILLTRAALSGGLVTGERSRAALRHAGRNGYFAIVLYGLLAVVALWFPLTVAAITAASWIFWLVLSIVLKPV